MTKKMSAAAILSTMPADVRALPKEEMRNWLCFKLGYSYFEPQVGKLTDRIIALRATA